MEEKQLFAKVFGWMFIGLIITFGTGLFVSNNINMLHNVVNNIWLIIIVEFVLVIILSARATKMQYTTGIILFCLYSFVSGLTFSSIFVIYQMDSIMTVFLISAGLFGLFALLGYKTNINLGKFSTIFFMILVGGIIVTGINFFLNNSMVDLIVSWVILIVFFGITAYDVQKIKAISYQIDDPKRVAVIGALSLYLDFINIFLRILSIFGKARD